MTSKTHKVTTGYLPRLGFVGAGKVATSLGRYLSEAGVAQLSGYYSRTLMSAKESAGLTGSAVYVNLSELVADSDVLLITTTDDQIVPVWQSLSPLDLNGKVVGHCSGALSSKALDKNLQQEAAVCSLHPLMAIKSKATPQTEMRQVFFTLEGDQRALDLLASWLDVTGNSYKIMPAKDKIRYHIGAVLISNLVLSLGNLSVELFQEYDFSETEALQALKSLATYNLEHFVTKGALASLTGPVERNDLGTVEKHLEALSAESYQEVRDIYQSLSLQLLKLAQDKHQTIDYDPLEQLLRKDRP